MNLILLLCCLILACDAMMNKLKYKRGPKKKQLTEGVEFNKITRSALLKILSAFEDNIHKNLRKKKIKPQFTAQFANSRYTRPFIYPNIFQAPKQRN